MMKANQAPANAEDVMSRLFGTSGALVVAACVYVVAALSGVSFQTTVVRSVVAGAVAGLVVRWVARWVLASILEDWRRSLRQAARKEGSS